MIDIFRTSGSAIGDEMIMTCVWELVNKKESVGNVPVNYNPGNDLCIINVVTLSYGKTQGISDCKPVQTSQPTDELTQLSQQVVLLLEEDAPSGSTRLVACGQPWSNGWLNKANVHQT